MEGTIDISVQVQEPAKSVELTADQMVAQYLKDSIALQRDDLCSCSQYEFFKDKYNRYPTSEDWDNMSVLAPESEIREWKKKKLQDRFHAIAQSRAEKRDI